MSLLSSVNLDLLPRSIVTAAGGEWALARDKGERRLVALLPPALPALGDLEGQRSEHQGRALLVGPASPRNAEALRRLLPWLAPAPLGARTSAGMGDRLGLATPGHVRAVRAAAPDVAPIFAQQSIREMTRTGRTPRQVMDDATWGTFEEGWRHGVGSDADHLKTTDEVDRCLAVGFTLFTLDPGAFVNASAESAGPAALAQAMDALPWAELEDTRSALASRYLGSSFDLGSFALTLDEATLTRAAVKYGAAVAHVNGLYRHLVQAARGRAFEVEVSVDETDAPTSHAEHVYIATELRRLGVTWVSLAPRFVGRFEKGVDYIGDLAAFEQHFAGHAAIAAALGPYKLSLHSGSDKFSIYPAAARLARGLVHLKTAGTSYLEALRVAASLDPPLFCEIYRFACERYEEDRASYHVSGQLDRAVAAAASIRDEGLPALLEHFDARQVLHVTFGSVLTALDPSGRPRFGDRLLALLVRSPDAYAEALERHFVRHLAPFAGHH